MTGADQPAASTLDPSVAETPAKHHPNRWCVNRGGIVNVWFYFDAEFTFSGGHCIWRGTNGAGKSRALEMLLPFLLDADRRKLDATGSGKVRVEDLMKAGGDEQSNRIGYLWLELVRDRDDGGTEYLTSGALVRFSRSTAEAKVWYFTTSRRVGIDLILLDERRMPLSRDQLVELVGADRVTDSPEAHRERLRGAVFALTGESGRERYAGLLQLLHTLRSPDVGNRIDEGRLPGILSDALPPLSEMALNRAGEQLDALTETREAQERLEEARMRIVAFLDIYRRYAAGVLTHAADEARKAASEDRKAERNAEDHHRRHRELSDELTSLQQQRNDLVTAESDLAETITGIKQSKTYADARDLDQREKRVEALAQTVDRSFHAAGTARGNEESAVSDADGCAGDIVTAAAKAASAQRDARQALDLATVHGTLPASVTAALGWPPATVDVVRCARDGDPVSVTRPSPKPVELLPADPAEAADQARTVKRAAELRVGQAGHRLSVALDLRRQEGNVQRADERADDAETEAERAVSKATEDAQRRDDEAVELAVSWRHWVADPTTTALLGAVEWRDTNLGALLADVEAMSGPDGDDQVLIELDSAANAAATPSRDALADRLAGLKQEQDEVNRVRDALLTEQDQLRKAYDPEPAAAPWHVSTPPGGVPLWRVVDFVSDIPMETRAKLEAALHAAGLLTATVTNGALTAADGQVLLTTGGPRAASPLSTVLVPDQAAPFESTVVAAILDRIAFRDRGHDVWVDEDGSWGNGPLTGRHHAESARHIGAEARAAARAARLAEIDNELTSLDDDDARRASDREALIQQREALTAHLRTAPRSSKLASLRSVAADSARDSEEKAGYAHKLRAKANDLRAAWHEANRMHEVACTAAQLPVTVDELTRARHAAEEAARLCERLAEDFVDVGQSVKRHSAALARVREARTRRIEAEETAGQDWRTWRSEYTEFEAIRANIGVEAERIREQLGKAEEQHQKTSTALQKARTDEAKLLTNTATAEQDVKHALEKAAEARVDLRARAEELMSIVRLPGVAAAALADSASIEVTVPEVSPASVETVARSLVGAIDVRGGSVDENQLIRAQQSLERELSGTFDVFASVTDGVWLIEFTDATGRRHLADAASDLTRRADQGRTALSDRERRVFTDFVLGGVAEELRRRLGQARQLIDAVNASLATIRTSHGIGVKVRWNLIEEAGSAIARIRELVMTAGEVRSPEQTAELTERIKDEVDRAFASDKTAGYAAHLKTALDYRRWHDVDVIILGPATGQERRISRRAKLSQGEVRFVSYVTLFAAVDAYLSGLPDTGRALRLILLDDAFAKVDDRTIGELMGLLVRLDIDFAMTGHALWGCYPQVPALDIYEVRRRPGTAAVTTHVHWDGRTRHLRPAG